MMLGQRVFRERLQRLRRGFDRRFWQRQISKRVIKVIVPTINSASHVDVILAHYREIGIPVSVFVDSKTTDETAAIAARYAHEVIPFKNTATRVGEMIEGMSKQSNARWILRIDDDELPSVRMMEFVRAIISQECDHVVGFSRYQSIFNAGGELFHHSAHTHCQWRMYRPDRVTFHGRGHTPGFDFSPRQNLIAPPDALMLHLDWAVHSREERIKKMERYDAHTPGHGMPNRSYYLADENANFRDGLRPLPLAEFGPVGAQLVARFPKYTVSM